jgi:hypothetical protein
MFFVFLALLAATLSCDKGKDSQPASTGGSGCIQGVLIDAITGKRIPVPTPTETEGVYVVVNNQKLVGTGMTAKDAKEGLFVGEYAVCGIPVENQFPLTISVAGYQSFFGKINEIRSTAANRTTTDNGILTEIGRPSPTELHNVRLFPIGAKALPLEITVFGGATPLAETTVQLEPKGSGLIMSNGGSFLPPSLERFEPLSGVTDEAGLVTFPGEQLVLGGEYTFTAIPKDIATYAITKGQGVYVGLSANNTGKDLPTKVSIKMSPALPTNSLYIVSTSLDLRNLESTGELRLVLSREAEILPDSLDGVTASLTGNTEAVLEVDEPGNKLSEMVKVTVSGREVILKPVFDKAADASKDAALAITYTGLKLRPKDPNAELDVLTVPPYTVRFFQ